MQYVPAYLAACNPLNIRFWLLYVSCALAGIRIESDRLICQQMGESLTIGFCSTFCPGAEYESRLNGVMVLVLWTIALVSTVTLEAKVIIQ